MSPASWRAASGHARGAIARLVAATALLLFVLSPLTGGAHETDQYTLPLGREFADLKEYFSRAARDAIAAAVEDTNAAIGDSLSNNKPTAETRRLQSPDYISRAVWTNLFIDFTTIEGLDARLAADAFGARYPGLVVAYKPEQHIYDDPLLLIDVTKVVRTFFRSATVNVDGTLLGTDKILHFIHMGRIYHSKYLGAREDGLTEEAAVARTVEVSAAGYNPFLSENGFLGKISTGVRSNADLAADYAGFKFYRNLTEPVRIGAKLLPPMLVRDGVYWRFDRRVRPESDFFAAFITPHFNEALNPNTYVSLTDARVRKMLQIRCFDLLHWYRDERGRVRNRQQFAAIERELSTFYGEPYGHESEGENTVSIANTCFQPGGSGEHAGASADPDPRQGSAQSVSGTSRANGQSTRIRWPGSDRFGRTELWWAARAGQVDVVERLIGQVENPNALDVDGEGPLHAAARGGHAAVVALLIAHGADPRVKDRYGTTPLHVSVVVAEEETARVLLDNGSDVNARDMFGLMPLHQAVIGGNREMAALLLDHGANPAARYRKLTPAQLANQAGNKTLAKWLDSYRKKPVVKGGGRTMQQTAARPQAVVPVVRLAPESVHRNSGSTNGG